MFTLVRIARRQVAAAQAQIGLRDAVGNERGVDRLGEMLLEQAPILLVAGFLELPKELVEHKDRQ